MSETAEKLLRELLLLPLPERMAIADRLGESIEEEVTHPPSPYATDEDAEEAYHALLLQRLDEAEKHPDRLIDGPEAMRRIREELAARRARRENP